jgi:hypothetical protein
MPESRTITVQMTVGGTDYYMAIEEFVGSNFYSPFVQSLPRIDWSGDGFMKTQAGNLTLTNQPDEDQHPFGYATNWSTLLSNPDQQFLTAIHPGEPKEKRLALWYGFSVLRSISENGLTFDLFENGTEDQLNLSRLVGNYAVATITAGNPTVLGVYVGEMGSGTPSDYIKVGDFIQVNNTPDVGPGEFPNSTIQANTNYLVVATNGNLISIDNDSTGVNWRTPTVVTNTYTNNTGYSRVIMDKVLTVPYVAFSEGMPQHNVSRDRYFQDGFFGHYFFTPYQNWNPSSGIGTTTKIFIDGSDQSSNFTLVGKSYKRTDGAAYDGTITFQTITLYRTVFDLVDLLFPTCDKTKAPNSDDSVKAGIMVEYTRQGNLVSFLDQITRNTNHQFYLRSKDGGGFKGFLIEKSNVPTAQALDEFEITAATYSFKQPTRAVTCEFTTRDESGTSAGNNFQFIESKKNVSVTNEDITSGAEIVVEQMHDSLGQQLNYLQAILDVQKKLYITVTLDHINEDILPGDNLSFSREIDKVTVSSLLVRKIVYDLNLQTTQFCGDGLITPFERT